MPQTKISRGPGLSIELDSKGYGQNFIPGEAITGHVIRRGPLVSPRALVTIRLIARTKVKLSVENENYGSTMRSRVDLLGSQSPSLTLHDGPVHVPPGNGESPGPGIWRFGGDDLRIPQTPDAQSVENDTETLGSKFVSSDPEDVKS